jgi:YbgC/YbaW family acyl-CoA thioester hydrolase
VLAVPTHREHLRVRWVDTDAGGRIHFTAAFRWAEQAELELYRRLGLLEQVPHLPRRHVDAEFHRVLVFDDEIDVTLTVASVGMTSITYEWQITRDHELAVEGRHTVVHVDAAGSPQPIDDAMRAALTGS